MTTFTVHSFMKRYLELKPVKWGFKWQFRCAVSTGYLYKFDLYLGKKKDIEGNLVEGAVLQLTNKVINKKFCFLALDVTRICGCI